LSRFERFVSVQCELHVQSAPNVQSAAVDGVIAMIAMIEVAAVSIASHIASAER
jgi:predicted hotdog family 3-hydroxylacyl-ACP dehydratase